MLSSVESRNIDFFNACESVRKKHPSLSVSEIAAIAVKKRAPSFYLTDFQIAKIVRQIRNGTLVFPNGVKGECYREIMRNYFLFSDSFRIAHPTIVVKSIADLEAPRFYMSDARATSLYYELLKRK